MGLAHPIFILPLVEAGGQVAIVWVKVKKLWALPAISSIQLAKWDNPIGHHVVSLGLKDPAGRG